MKILINNVATLLLLHKTFVVTHQRNIEVDILNDSCCYAIFWRLCGVFLINMLKEILLIYFIPSSSLMFCQILNNFSCLKIHTTFIYVSAAEIRIKRGIWFQHSKTFILYCFTTFNRQLWEVRKKSKSFSVLFHKFIWQ